ncbi:MAG: TetR/AcrR family transcriptional regulator [Candidatus Dormibacteria bacterium]
MKASPRTEGIEAVGGGEPVLPDGSREPRPLRADAVRNRQRLLEAAEATFAKEGAAVSIDTVAERAGVGVGTVYRHFPTKEALFQAIVMARLQELLDALSACSAGSDPGEAISSFLRHFARQAAAKQDLFDAMSAAGIDIKSSCSVKVDQLRAAFDVLLTRAKTAGDVRPDVSTDEIFGLVSAACKSADRSGADDASLQRMAEIVCIGIGMPASV